MNKKNIFNDLEPLRVSGQSSAQTSRILFKSRHFNSRNSKSSKVSPNSKDLSRKVSEILLPVAEKVHKKIILAKHSHKQTKLIDKKQASPALSPNNLKKNLHRRVLSDGCNPASQPNLRDLRELKDFKAADAEEGRLEKAERAEKTDKAHKVQKVDKGKVRLGKTQSLAKIPSACNLETRVRGFDLQDEENEKASLVKFITQYFRRFGTCPETGIEYYKVESLIGKGAFAKVLLCEHKLTGKKVAIKAIPKASLQNSRSQKKVVQEVYIMKRVRSKFVIKILEVFESEKNFLIVMEYAGGGDLLHYVRDKKQLREEECKRIFKQILMGAASIHNSGVLHRDFKMDNILLDSSYSTVKICDFGVSKLVKQGEVIKEQCGTPAYIAPEIIKNEGYEGYTVDIWSLGVVLYTMLCGTIPFKANNINDLHTLILSGNFDLPFDLSIQAKDLIIKMIKLNPYERISIENALKHDWFNVRMKEADRTTPQFFPRIFKEKDEENRESVLKAVAELGFERDFVIKSLKDNEMNHATVSYYLMM